jgi:hypothetical protein
MNSPIKVHTAIVEAQSAAGFGIQNHYPLEPSNVRGLGQFLLGLRR